MKRKVACFVFISVIVIAGVGLNQVWAQQTIRIGVLYPLTGSLALLGNENMDGAKVALDMVNETGGILGKKVEFATGDASTPDKAQSEAERLISLEGVKVLTGTYSSGLSYAASQVAERHKVVYWETGGIADRLTERGFKYYFRVVYTATSNGELAANFSKEVLAPKIGKKASDLKLFVIHEDSDYGTTVGKAAETHGKEIGFNVLGRDPYKSTSTDLSPLILRMKALRPDIIVASSYANDALLIQRQMKQLGVYVSAYIGTGGIHGLPSYGEGLGNAVNGIVDTEGAANVNMSTLSKDLRALAEEWQRRYTGQYKKVPSYIATQGFVGTYMLLKDVIAVAGGTDPDKVREAALKLDIPLKGTILGWGVKFAQPGTPMEGTNLRSFPVAQQWQNNKLVVVYPNEFKMGDVTMIPLPAWDKR